MAICWPKRKSENFLTHVAMFMVNSASPPSPAFAFVWVALGYVYHVGRHLPPLHGSSVSVFIGFDAPAFAGSCFEASARPRNGPGRQNTVSIGQPGQPSAPQSTATIRGRVCLARPAVAGMAHATLTATLPCHKNGPRSGPGCPRTGVSASKWPKKGACQRATASRSAQTRPPLRRTGADPSSFTPRPRIRGGGDPGNVSDPRLTVDGPIYRRPACNRVAPFGGMRHPAPALRCHVNGDRGGGQIVDCALWPWRMGKVSTGTHPLGDEIAENCDISDASDDEQDTTGKRSENELGLRF